MNDILYELFGKLDGELSKVEKKYDSSADEVPEFEVVAGLDKAGKAKGNDQTGDLSGKIASLNDRFRQNPDAEDNDIKGEWVMGKDITALPFTTKAAIKKRIADYSAFDDRPLHDRGSFTYESNGNTYKVLWMIKVFEDASKSAEASKPEDQQASYRVLVATLSGQ